ncbi:MAG TPA: DUF72 domain-containing protein, partial [Desulfosarcina sp.]|nr:DUF72 domain-containing protein [Desulfosarcina sp.]
MSCQILVGTSGYSYTEWVEAGIYPAGTQPGRMLGIYAQRFPATELNFTWYQMPKPDALERMQRQVPETFRFSVKLNRGLTHEVDPDEWAGLAKQFREGISPLIQSGQLAAILAQLPPSFRRTPDNRQYLARLLDTLEGLPLAVEFRHASWVSDRVFAGMAERRLTLAAVDVPDLPGL